MFMLYGPMAFMLWDVFVFYMALVPTRVHLMRHYDVDQDQRKKDHGHMDVFDIFLMRGEEAEAARRKADADRIKAEAAAAAAHTAAEVAAAVVLAELAAAEAVVAERLAAAEAASLAVALTAAIKAGTVVVDKAGNPVLDESGLPTFLDDFIIEDFLIADEGESGEPLPTFIEDEPKQRKESSANTVGEGKGKRQARSKGKGKRQTRSKGKGNRQTRSNGPRNGTRNGARNGDRTGTGDGTGAKYDDFSDSDSDAFLDDISDDHVEYIVPEMTTTGALDHPIDSTPFGRWKTKGRKFGKHNRRSNPRGGSGEGAGGGDGGDGGGGGGGDGIVLAHDTVMLLSGKRFNTSTLLHPGSTIKMEYVGLHDYMVIWLYGYMVIGAPLRWSTLGD